MTLPHHQYIDRYTGEIRTERLFADRIVNFIYNELRENLPTAFRAMTGAKSSDWIGYLNFESVINARLASPSRRLRAWNVDVSECLEPEKLDTPAGIFMRKIRYWERRPMTGDARTVVSPADSRVILGSLRETSQLFIKNKFFDYEEMLGLDRAVWLEAFEDGEFAIFRLTPEKYHFNHTPAAGRVVDFYEIDGTYHACNPGAVVSMVTPFSKNKRAVTILDTDTPGGTGAGLVAMIEVAALMVGDIQQAYSWDEYNYPVPVKTGLFLERGQPKSLFRPGSSTVVLFFQKDRIRFDPDLIENQYKNGVVSRFSMGFGRPLVETDVLVRSRIGQAIQAVWEQQMTGAMFIGAIGLAYVVLLWWACRHLPSARWQVLAAAPVRQMETGEWLGVNITWYGVFQAGSITIGLALILIMMASVGVAPVYTLLVLGPLLAVCVPASSLIARIVEKKSATLTVSGASFCGLILLPWLTWLVSAGIARLDGPAVPVLAMFSAASVAYAFGEGLGRLACISFGCCYGRPLDQCPAWVERLFARHHFIFHGQTKKIAYDGGLEGRPVLPIQAITSAVYGTAGMVGLSLFLTGRFVSALLASLIVTQVWRVYSEFWRADFRGTGCLTVYQKLSLLGVFYGAAVCCIARSPRIESVDLAGGLTAIWHPAVMIGLEAVWVITLVYFGFSTTTDSRIRLHVVKSRV